MPSLLTLGRRGGWLCLLLLLGPAGAQTPAPAKPDPAVLRLKSVAELTPRFSAYVFHGERFPSASLDAAAKPDDLLGPHTIRTTFYDADLRKVDRAAKVGPYAAIVEVIPKEGRALTRYVTLYRSPEPASGNAPFDPSLAEMLGLDAKVVAAESKLLLDTLKRRPFSECAKDPRAARLLAGLALTKTAPDPVRKYNDAFAVERQWWVGLKRQRYGWDKQFPNPFVAPSKKEGEPAPVVRTGSAAEAGMKPDTAAKLDAICAAWGADTDQAFAVCVVRHGVIVLHKAYGTRDGKPMTTETPSWMASVTKAMSATMMMMVVDRGLVSLDDPVDKFLPPLRGVKVATPLRARNLYNHTGGLGEWPGWNDEMADVELRVADYYPKLRVGKEWKYTGTGNILGGKIMEAVSGEAVPQFYQHHLLGPLGMKHTDVVGTHADAFSVPLDVAKFGQMLLNRGSYGDQQFFRPETFEQMLPKRLTDVLGPDTKKTFGIGLDGTPMKFGHGAASSATFHIDREADLVVIITRNKGGKNDDKYGGKFWDAIRAGMVKP